MTAVPVGTNGWPQIARIPCQGSLPGFSLCLMK